jgi:DNA repair photolyase
MGPRVAVIACASANGKTRPRAPNFGACDTTSVSSAPSFRGAVRCLCEHAFVRWSNLTIEEEGRARLPGYRDGAVVRHFEAPGAVSTRFYEVSAKSILNRVPAASRMPFRWTINPYRGCSHACVYCFARPTHTYLDFDAGRDFEREIVVKVNAPELLRAELARASWRGEHVALGTNTDPYQWVEGRYRLMPGIWEALRDARNECSVLTKSPLLLRDLDLMKEIAARTSFSAALSIPTIDEKAWRATEPHTPNPRARMEAVAELVRSGIRTGILVAPLMPGINDAPEQVEEILRLAHEAGADYVTGIALHVRGEVRALFFDWLRDHRPELVGRYERLYSRGAYAPVEERRRLASLLRDGRSGREPAPGGDTLQQNDHEPKDSRWMRGTRRDPALERRSSREVVQKRLF